MKLSHLFGIITIAVCVVNAVDQCANVKTSLEKIRKKRFLTFPTGTAMVITLSLVKAIMVHAPSGWNVAVEIDVIFPLASAEMLNEFYRKKMHHRQKRDFWEKLQGALDSYNINGRACTYRSICEAKEYLAPPGKSLVHDILRTIFHAPIQEEGFKEEMNGTYDELHDPNFCDTQNDCPISILDMVLSLNKKVD